MGGSYRTHERFEKHTTFRMESLKVTDHSEGRSIILKWTFRKWGGGCGLDSSD
jgi:hypothetical protein